jgi:GNAT superfamily N-acetyltransferase
MIKEQTMVGDIAIRSMIQDDWEIYRDLWLECLQTEAWAFSVSYKQKSTFTEQQWRKACFLPHQIQSFMLTDKSQPIGLSSVMKSKTDPEGKTALLLRQYIKSDYRGCGYSDYIYRAGLQWALDEGLNYAEVAYRRTNGISQQAGTKWGFTHHRTVSGRIFEGKPDDVHYYRLNLADVVSHSAGEENSHCIGLLTPR